MRQTSRTSRAWRGTSDALLACCGAGREERCCRPDDEGVIGLRSEVPVGEIGRDLGRGDGEGGRRPEFVAQIVRDVFIRLSGEFGRRRSRLCDFDQRQSGCRDRVRYHLRTVVRGGGVGMFEERSVRGRILVGELHQPRSEHA